MTALENPFGPTAEFWLDDGLPVAVDIEGVFVMGDAGNKALIPGRTAPWPEDANTRGPLTWDAFVEANLAFDAKMATL